MVITDHPSRRRVHNGITNILIITYLLLLVDVVLHNPYNTDITWV